MTDYETVLVDQSDRVGTITLNRPAALNALNSQLMGELVGAVELFDRDPDVGAVVIRGSDRAFAAGADIAEMVGQTYQDVFLTDWFAAWDSLALIRKPIIAAVSGYALGGGCELAMMCDVVIAGMSARFGQPEIRLGTIPGIGGTQRLTRAIGKAKAMDLILTGRMMDASEAESAGLVSRVVEDDQLFEVALSVAKEIAAKSLPAVFAAKESVNRSLETSLAEGIRFERRTFQATFALADRHEGMSAFLEKREPRFRHL